MLVLFETSVGYAIFKVSCRLNRWGGKAGVGQERTGKDEGEDETAQDRVGAVCVLLP